MILEVKNMIQIVTLLVIMWFLFTAFGGGGAGAR